MSVLADRIAAEVVLYLQQSEDAYLIDDDAAEEVRSAVKSIIERELAASRGD